MQVVDLVFLPVGLILFLGESAIGGVGHVLEHVARDPFLRKRRKG